MERTATRIRIGKKIQLLIRRAICAIGRAIAMPAAIGLKTSRENSPAFQRWEKSVRQKHSSPFRDDRSSIGQHGSTVPKGLRIPSAIETLR
jgi:hypothetical protein